MATITITITLPEGATVDVVGTPDPAKVEWRTEPHDWVGRFWTQYLSENGKKVFRQAARTEQFAGPGYTLEELARALSIDYESLKSYHRSAGRSAKRWQNETGMPVPIRLEPIEYAWDEGAQGNRTRYRLPSGVARSILDLEESGQ